MKIILNIMDRIIVMSKLIPDQSNMVTMMIWKKIVDSVVLTQEEIDSVKLEMKTSPSDPRVSTQKFDPNVALTIKKEIEFDEMSLKIIKARIHDLDEHSKISIDMIDTINKFS